MNGLRVLSFGDEAAPAERLAAAMGAERVEIVIHRFPDGESLPRVPAPSAAWTVIYRSLDRPDGKLVELLLAADAARRAGAERLVLVASYLCYLRQDAVFHAGEPLSRNVILRLIGARFDQVVTVEPHLHRTVDLAQALGASVAVTQELMEEAATERLRAAGVRLIDSTDSVVHAAYAAPLAPLHARAVARALRR